MSYNFMRNVCSTFYCFLLQYIHQPQQPFPHIQQSPCICIAYIRCLFVKPKENHFFNGRINSLFTYPSFEKKHTYERRRITIYTLDMISTSTVVRPPWFIVMKFISFCSDCIFTVFITFKYAIQLEFHVCTNTSEPKKHKQTIKC